MQARAPQLSESHDHPRSYAGAMRERPRAELVTRTSSAPPRACEPAGWRSIPTETVYGLAADAEQPAAVARVFAVKGRRRDHPLIVHIGAAELLAVWVVERPAARRRARRRLLAGTADAAAAALASASPTS